MAMAQKERIVFQAYTPPEVQWLLTTSNKTTKKIHPSFSPRKLQPSMQAVGVANGHHPQRFWRIFDTDTASTNCMAVAVATSQVEIYGNKTTQKHHG